MAATARDPVSVLCSLLRAHGRALAHSKCFMIFVQCMNGEWGPRNHSSKAEVKQKKTQLWLHHPQPPTRAQVCPMLWPRWAGGPGPAQDSSTEPSPCLQGCLCLPPPSQGPTLSCDQSPNRPATRSHTVSVPGMFAHPKGAKLNPQEPHFHGGIPSGAGEEYRGELESWEGSPPHSWVW